MALLNPSMKFKKNFGQKSSFQALWKYHFQKIFSRVCQIQDLGRSRYKLRLFFKKDSRDLKKSFYLGLLWTPSKPGKQNWKLPFFWVFIIVKITVCTNKAPESVWIQLAPEENPNGLLKPCWVLALGLWNTLEPWSLISL